MENKSAPASPATVALKHCAHDYDPPMPPKLPQGNGRRGALQRVFCCQCGTQGDVCARLPKHGKYLPRHRLEQMPPELFVLFDDKGEDWPCPGPKLQLIQG